MTLSFFRNEKFFPDVLGHFIILSNYLFVEIKSRVRSERIGLSFFPVFQETLQRNLLNIGKETDKYTPRTRKLEDRFSVHVSWKSVFFSNHKHTQKNSVKTECEAYWLNQGIRRGWAPSHLLISKFEFSWLVSKTFSHQSERRGVQHLSPDGVVGHWARSILTKSGLLNTKNRLLFSQLQIHVLTAARNGCYSTKTRKMKPWYLLIAYLRSICSPSDCTVLS